MIFSCQSLRAQFLNACCLVLDACCLMPDACLLLAAWCLNTCQTHPQREAACGRLHKGGASRTKQQALRNWALRLWQEKSLVNYFLTSWKLYKFVEVLDTCKKGPRWRWRFLFCSGVRHRVFKPPGCRACTKGILRRIPTTNNQQPTTNNHIAT